MDFELFKKIIDEINKHSEWQKTFTNFLEEHVCPDSWAFVTAGDNLISLLITILEKEFKDEDAWVTWWLYEDVDKIVTYPDKSTKDINKIEDFYEFLVENKKEKENIK